MFGRKSACGVAIAVMLWLLVPSIAGAAGESLADPAKVDEIVRAVVNSEPGVRAAALTALRQRGKKDVVPALILVLRHVGLGRTGLAEALKDLAGIDNGDRWHDWMLWQEAHPEIEPYDGFDGFMADFLSVIDPNFRLFLYRGVKHEIRLEEITWGGVIKDGIPALVNPTHVAPAEADYLEADELVFGVAINGDARAYPLRILDWHEMFNDVVGGVDVALAYCTLCGSGILFETKPAGKSEPFVLGSSGFLYRSNKLMYDRQTNSLWNQFTGRPVVGPLTGSGIELKIRPVTITSWSKWLARHPDTTVLSLNTGYVRDYRPGRPYGAYFNSPDLMFPALVGDKRLQAKDYVFGLRAAGHEKAWPLSAFAGGRVINDSVGDLDVVLIGDAGSRTVRAYQAGGRDFAAAGADRLISDGKVWRVEEAALVGADGGRLERLPGHIAYWFAWSGYKPAASLYGN